MRWLSSILVLPAVVLASSITPHTLQQRAEASDRVALVQVLTHDTVVDPKNPRKMMTYSRLAIAQDYKGEGPQHVTLAQIGGKNGPWEVHVDGDAQLAVGMTLLVFLKCPQPDTCGLVSLGAGALRMVDGKLLVPDLATQTVSAQTLPQVVAQLGTEGKAK